MSLPANGRRAFTYMCTTWLSDATILYLNYSCSLTQQRPICEPPSHSSMVPALSSSSWLLSGDRMEIGVTATPGHPRPGHPDHRPATLGWRLIILSNLASSRQRPGDQIFQISHLPQIMFLIIENIFNLDDFLQKVYSFWKVKCSDNVLSGACLQLWSWFKMQQRR